MDISITEIGLISSANGYIRAYILATATDAGKTLTEEFVIGRQVVGRQIVTNAQGWLKTTSGTFVDPATLDPSQPEPLWEYEAVTQDLKTEILNLLRTSFRSQFDQGFTGDHTGDATKPLFRNGSLVRQSISQIIQRGGTLGLPLPVRQLVGTVVVG